MFDTFPNYKGIVSWGYTRDTEHIALGSVNNTITYSGADIMAKLLGGNQQFKISHMGFIFGAVSDPLFTLSPARSSSWTGLSTELQGDGRYNILVTPIATAPTYFKNKTMFPEAEYEYNTVTFSGASSDSIETAFKNGGAYKPSLEDGDYIYHTVLLANMKTLTGEYDFKVFARGSLLKDGVYPQKIKGWGVSVQWDVIFY